MKRSILLNLILSCVFLCSCSPAKNSPRGFSFPEGDAASGKMVFVTLQCNTCHSTPDIAQLASSGNADSTSRKLGREVGKVKTYADLVTSIINPSHRISWAHPYGKEEMEGVSRMRVYNELMTVTQLIDLVSYLQPHYPLRVATPTQYEDYYPDS